MMRRVFAAHPGLPRRDVSDPPSVVQALRAVLRAGTTSMTAGDAGLPGRADRALIALIERAAHGGDGLAVIKRQVMRIDPGAGREPLFGMFFGAASFLKLQ